MSLFYIKLHDPVKIVAVIEIGFFYKHIEPRMSKDVWWISINLRSFVDCDGQTRIYGDLVILRADLHVSLHSTDFTDMH